MAKINEQLDNNSDLPGNTPAELAQPTSLDSPDATEAKAGSITGTDVSEAVNFNSVPSSVNVVKDEPGKTGGTTGSSTNKNKPETHYHRSRAALGLGTLLVAALVTYTAVGSADPTHNAMFDPTPIATLAPTSTLIETPTPTPEATPTPTPEATTTTPIPQPPATQAPAPPQSGQSPQVTGVTAYSQIGGSSCEAAALETALSAAGIYPSQQTIINEENPTMGDVSWDSKYGVYISNGDPNLNFVGDPYADEQNQEFGYGAFPPILAAIAQEQGATVLWSGAGISISQLYQYVENGNPAVVLVNDNDGTEALQNDGTFDVTAADGATIPYPINGSEHAVTLIGVNTANQTVDILNPLDGSPWWSSSGAEGWIPMSNFENSFATFGNRAVVIQK